MRGIAIVSPGHPHVAGGVTDHTTRLSASWREAGHRVTVIGTTELTSVPDLTDIEGVLIQYVPFLYGRWGLSSFPLQLARSARRAGARVVVFVHEPWVPPTRLPWLVLSPLQRRQLRALARAADHVVTAVPRWQSLFDGPGTLIYVGSTLGPPAPADAPLLSAPVVFSPMNAGLRWPWIAAAVRAIGATPPLIAIGADRAQATAARRIARWIDDRWEWHGYLPAPGALASLSRAPLVLCPLLDGVTGRRTSLLAALSVGARVVTSRGHLFDPWFDAAPMDIADTERAFVDAAVRRWHAADPPEARASRRAWYDEHLDPAALDRRLLSLLTGS